jgi:hypothetical protein
MQVFGVVVVRAELVNERALIAGTTGHIAALAAARSRRGRGSWLRLWAVSGQRRSKTMRALTWPFSISSKHSLTSSSLRVSRITRVRPWVWIA